MIAVAGASGFLGTALMGEMTNASTATLGIVRRNVARPSPHEFAAIDLSHDVDAVKRELDRFRVTLLVHLALVSKPTFDESPTLAATGVEAIDNTLIEACRRSKTLRTILLVSSAAVYGDAHPRGYRIRESAQLAPGSIYGQIKLAQEKRWRRADLRQNLSTARVFNLIGPGEPTSYVCSSIANNLSTLPEGQPLSIRNSESTRDFCDVRDAASALVALTSLGEKAPPIVNICSGVATTIRELSEVVVRVSGRNVGIAPDNSGVESRSLGDPSLVRSATNWRQRFNLENSAAAVWLERSQRVA